MHVIAYILVYISYYSLENKKIPQHVRAKSLKYFPNYKMNDSMKNFE